ncbi:hypothetical protein, partial [Staphylococcus simulans]|uniref:hypothetical protein n=1 Tax=Staphylococcus simulans TaxID=1286 RepID=UPI0028A34595
ADAAAPNLSSYLCTNAKTPATSIKIPDKIPNKPMKIKFSTPPITSKTPIKTRFLLLNSNCFIDNEPLNP